MTKPTLEELQDLLNGPSVEDLNADTLDLESLKDVNKVLRKILLEEQEDHIADTLFNDIMREALCAIMKDGEQLTVNIPSPFTGEDLVAKLTKCSDGDGHFLDLDLNTIATEKDSL